MEMEHDDLAGTSVPVPPDVNAMKTLTRIAKMMPTQQHQMAQLLQHQLVVLDQLISGRSTVEKRVEGIYMPTYHGRQGEPLYVFLHQVKLNFSAKNIDFQDSKNQGRLIAVVASNWKGQTAVWSTFNQEQTTTLSELADALQAELIPPDLQESLRVELFRLKQANCNILEEYVSRFRTIICQMKDM
ncbi:hypothetical protein PsorP6_010955 [Peronosclerospora sorghi]|uniref:Uncharacterized protein n=1 Tax=Peronosclerospora sorghi TaxID=230839 RepID=A0ACC0VVJ1_9STRA|nr:hypothetical protein PsorP6_010955 [Peronosclerospora sorghi]